MEDINTLSCWFEEGFEFIRRQGHRRIDQVFKRLPWIKNPIKFLSARSHLEKAGASLTCHHN